MLFETTTFFIYNLGSTICYETSTLILSSAQAIVSTLTSFVSRRGLRDLHDRHLHGHVLQHDHRLGGLLPGGLAGVAGLAAAMDQL